MARSNGKASPWVASGGPSILAGDRHFTANRDGLTKSQRATLTVEKRKREQGWCPGVIWGLSAKADQQVRAPKRKEQR